MIDERDILEQALRRFEPEPGLAERVYRRRDRKRRNQRIGAGVIGIVIAIAVGWLGVNTIRSTHSVPADHSEGLGIFAPVASRIVYAANEARTDLGYDRGLWAIDPSGPPTRP